ncbi:MAG: hypothetical protein A2Z29_09375 [Chloroflexi bacterium RBG_16_56_11]|nr:MAG: hypothetical protein A2Z29_09375 [Chloroflexi bacterium RBG_16_56_11]
MSIKEFAEKFIKAEDDAFLTGNFDALEKLEDPKVIFHLFAIDQEISGWEAHKQYIIGMKQAAPGIRPDWQYLTGEGKLFTLLLKMSGARFTGQVPGWPPPTDKEITVSSLWIFRLNKGKIVEGWSNGSVSGLT